MKPVIGVTMGDAAGIGPEIVAKALGHPQVFEHCRPIVIGDKRIMEEVLQKIGADMKIRSCADLPRATYKFGQMNVFDLHNIKRTDFVYGRVNAALGRAAGEYIAKAVQLAVEGKIDAIVTAPINKESFFAGGYGQKYSGHTEMLAGLTGAEDVKMLLVSGNLRVIHVSTHVALRKAVDEIKEMRVYRTILTASRACRQLGIENPRIAVSGLNPHCGEGGIMGDEEIKEIRPAVDRAISEGLKVAGPYPADTIFPRGLAGDYDIIVAMYHDQGHIPVKLHGFKWQGTGWSSIRGVNITIGLPIIRTSVDHGTAFGKAGKGLADETSLLEAIEYAVRLSENRDKAAAGDDG